MFCTTGEYQEFTVNNAVNVTQQLRKIEVLLDNQADISIVYPMLLENVRPAEREIRVKGVEGVQMKVNKVGDLPNFFKVYASAETKANVLSFANVKDLYDITYVRQQAFVVHMQERDLVFTMREKLYVADLYDEEHVVQATIRENEALYTREEVKCAKKAYEFLRNSEYPSIGEAVHLLTDGNVRGVPLLMRADVERAYKIYGVHPEYVRGKLTKKTVGRVKADPTLRSVSKTLSMYVDVMHVDTKRFMVSVADPLNLTLQSCVASESRQDLGMALQGQLTVLRIRGYVPTVVYTDPQSAFKSITQDFPGIEIDIGGAGDYVAKVDAHIRRVKEMYRTVKAGLPWMLPRSLVPELIAYKVSHMNIRRTTALSENVYLRVRFKGIPVDFKRELCMAFGDYVEAYKGTDNTSKTHVLHCILWLTLREHGCCGRYPINRKYKERTT